MPSGKLPDGLIAFGGKANCTIELCGIEASILEYQPSKAASGIFIALFFISMVIHIIQGFRWKTASFAICMAIGCIDEIIGYGGRILLHDNPFSFAGFMIQIGRFLSISGRSRAFQFR